MRISGPSGGDSLGLPEMEVTVTAHGEVLLKLGYTVESCTTMAIFAKGGLYGFG